jgi:hypothetical protein
MCETILSNSTCAPPTCGAWRFTCRRKAASVLGFGTRSSFAQGYGVPSLVLCHAGVVSSAATSAACHDLAEHVRVFPIVVSGRELVEVQGQVPWAHLMVTAHDATLQQARERVDVLRVDHTTDVLTLRMLDRFVRVAPPAVSGRPGSRRSRRGSRSRIQYLGRSETAARRQHVP